MATRRGPDIAAATRTDASGALAWRASSRTGGGASGPQDPAPGRLGVPRAGRFSKNTVTRNRGSRGGLSALPLVNGKPVASVHAPVDRDPKTIARGLDEDLFAGDPAERREPRARVLDE